MNVIAPAVAHGLVRTDVLGDATGLTRGNVGFADRSRASVVLPWST